MGMGIKGEKKQKKIDRKIVLIELNNKNHP
jgi:hypothetical protein